MATADWGYLRLRRVAYDEAQLRAWDKIIDKESKDNPDFAKILSSQKDWASRVVPWRQLIMVENETAYNYYFQRR